MIFKTSAFSSRYFYVDRIMQKKKPSFDKVSIMYTLCLIKTIAFCNRFIFNDDRCDVELKLT